MESLGTRATNNLNDLEAQSPPGYARGLAKGSACHGSRSLSRVGRVHICRICMHIVYTL